MISKVPTNFLLLVGSSPKTKKFSGFERDVGICQVSKPNVVVLIHCDGWFFAAAITPSFPERGNI